ncbi:MAG: SDR family oxidoreductase [Verrucomicrobiae bacterium]
MNETVLITGASSGIGLELAKCFAADKSNLILVARSTAALETLAAELRHEQNIEVHVVTADLSRPEAATEIFEQTGRAGLTVDVLVNNAGFGLHGSFVELPQVRQLEIIQVNVAALVELTGLFLPSMLKRRRGGVLNVGSVAGFLPGPNMAVYYASKAFVLSFSEALHEELVGSGICVTNLCPGPTETNFSQVARSHRVRETRTHKVSASSVARIGHEDFRNDQCLSVPGLQNKFLTAVVTKLLPRWALRSLASRYNKLK